MIAVESRLDGCTATPPASRAQDIERMIQTIDPDEAYQGAVRHGLVIQHPDPLNCEISISDLVEGEPMPTAHHYVRNHFRIPSLDPASWRLNIGGLVEHRLALSLDELRNMPSRTLAVTLECAGNGRSMLRPAVEGESWGLGAVSTADWTGVPLSEVLNRAGVESRANEVIFRGADGGTVSGRTGMTRFERSLRLDDVREFEPLLAYAMNGVPLPVEHGFPLRLIVPRWYGVAAVKWLTEIEVTDSPFGGYFQNDRYVYEWDDNRQPAREPVTVQRVRALITEPAPDQGFQPGDLAVHGVAWSGAAPITRVEVSCGGGPWQATRLLGEPTRYGWRWWEITVGADHPGAMSIRARASDAAGHTQPKDPEWNRLGYGVNAVHQVVVRIR